MKRYFPYPNWRRLVATLTVSLYALAIMADGFDRVLTEYMK